MHKMHYFLFEKLQKSPSAGDYAPGHPTPHWEFLATPLLRMKYRRKILFLSKESTGV